MELHHAFTVRTPIDTTFRALTDLEFIAPCMPGARLDGRDGAFKVLVLLQRNAD